MFASILQPLRRQILHEHNSGKPHLHDVNILVFAVAA